VPDAFAFAVALVFATATAGTNLATGGYFEVVPTQPEEEEAEAPDG
jgi:hypothetical protein